MFENIAIMLKGRWFKAVFGAYLIPVANPTLHAEIFVNRGYFIFKRDGVDITVIKTNSTADTIFSIYFDFSYLLRSSHNDTEYRTDGQKPENEMS